MRGRGIGQIVNAFEILANVVRIQHGVFGGLPQAVGAVRQNVGQRADEHAEVAVESAHPSDGLRPVIFEPSVPSGFRHNTGVGRNGSRIFFTATGPEPGPPPPCGVENVLCRFRCITSTPKSPGRDFADERVHIRAVHVQQRRLWRAGFGDLVDVLLENAQRVGVGEHQRGDVFVHHALQRCHIDLPCGIRT